MPNIDPIQEGLQDYEDFQEVEYELDGYDEDDERWDEYYMLELKQQYEEYLDWLDRTTGSEMACPVCGELMEPRLIYVHGCEVEEMEDG